MRRTFALVGVCLALLGVGLSVGPERASAACASHDLTGFAWSSNIGWISFSCQNGSTSINYGIDIDSSNKLSGYAWSHGVGWIDFDPAGTPPSGSADVYLESDGELTGWARVCSVFQTGCSGSLKPNSERGDWDGWISLNGSNHGSGLYGVSFDSNEDAFGGYAWGAHNVGWVSFSGATYAVTRTYSLTLRIQGNGNVDLTEPSTTCSSSECVYTYSSGSDTILTPVETDSDYIFNRWITCGNEGANDSCMLTMEQDRSITAEFLDLQGFEVTTEEVSQEGATQVALSGTLSADNGFDTTVYFRYGQGSAPSATCEDSLSFGLKSEEQVIQNPDSDPEEFEISVEELEQNTDYYYCAIAAQTSSEGTVKKFGDVISDRTLYRPIYEIF